MNGFEKCVRNNTVSASYPCCPVSFQLSFCKHFADRKYYVIQPIFLLFQLYRKQLLVVRPQCTPHGSSCFCSEAAKRQNTKKRKYSSSNRNAGKVETADSPWNFGQIFPTVRLWKVSGKVESFFSVGKVESLWSGKQKFVENFVENLPSVKRRFHKLWKLHSTAFYHGFHNPDAAAVKCRGHSGHFFCT